ncbi:MAG: 2,3-cyclic 3-phosphodiesterase [Solirubrobacteraceae bacterium]|nr:2,3-cyclic 3-phosphodiesterase [Solirubrobacteraceae bacterium]
MRLFVALDLPEGVRETIVAWGRRVLGEAPAVRLLAPESLHVTLCFLGSQPASQVDRIAAVCGLAAAFPAPRLSLARAVWLPRRRPRVLAVELEDRLGTLGELQSALSDRLSAAGWYQAERRRFLPHVTIARVARSAPPLAAPPLAAPLAALSDPPRADFAGPRVTLYRSRLQPGGARYEALGSVALSDVGRPAPRMRY